MKTTTAITIARCQRLHRLGKKTAIPQVTPVSHDTRMSMHTLQELKHIPYPNPQSILQKTWRISIPCEYTGTMVLNTRTVGQLTRFHL